MRPAPSVLKKSSAKPNGPRRATRDIAGGFADRLTDVAPHEECRAGRSGRRRRPARAPTLSSRVTPSSVPTSVNDAPASSAARPALSSARFEQTPARSRPAASDEARNGHDSGAVSGSAPNHPRRTIDTAVGPTGAPLHGRVRAGGSYGHQRPARSPARLRAASTHQEVGSLLAIRPRRRRRLVGIAPPWTRTTGWPRELRRLSALGAGRLSRRRRSTSVAVVDRCSFLLGVLTFVVGGGGGSDRSLDVAIEEEACGHESLRRSPRRPLMRCSVGHCDG